MFFHTGCLYYCITVMGIYLYQENVNHNFFNALEQYNFLRLSFNLREGNCGCAIHPAGTA